MRTSGLVIGAVLLSTSQSAGQTRAWVSRLGRDTLAVEKYTRSGDRLEGDLVTFSPRTLPSPGGTTLIVNRQTKQWGTEYDASKDLGRVAAKIESLSAPTERFTIAIVPAGAGGELRFEWDQVRYSVPFKVKS